MKPETVRSKLAQRLHKILPDLVDAQRPGEESEAYAARRKAAEETAARLREAAELLKDIDQRPSLEGVAAELCEYSPPPIVFDRAQLEAVIGHALTDAGVGEDLVAKYSEAVRTAVMLAAVDSEGTPLLRYRPIEPSKE